MEEEDDEEEREVEAFKRLCFHSRPQKSKIKAPELPQELKIRSRTVSSEDKGYGSDKDCCSPLNSPGLK